MVSLNKDDSILKKNNKTYLLAMVVIAATVLVILGAYFIAIKPLYNKSKSLNAELKVVQADLKNLQNKKAKLETLKNKEDQLKADAENVKKALPEGKDIGRLFIQFDELAKSSQGTVKSVNESGSTGQVATATKVTPTAETTQTGTPVLQKLNYAMPIDFPSYFNLKDFFGKAEKALRLISVDQINISANEGGAMSINLNLATYTRTK